MKLDLSALGAPALPEGLFYRIRAHELGWVEFEIRERRRFGSRLVQGSEVHVDPSTHRTVADVLLQGCTTANDRRIAALNRRSMFARTADCAGDYNSRGGN
ncbi:hypothetical protein [Kitasatospora sp. NPDC101183]|uniref:hypothetical protein n=1 Tax=Kitasatospora sp. NPDC101183 TaxID=3364100 RepID=UPI0037F4C1E4